MLDYDKKQILWWRRWLWPVLIFAILLTVERIDIIRDIYTGDQVVEAGETILMVLDALKSETIMLILPILCAFPYASAMTDELRSGMIKQVLTRTSHDKYVSSKAIACVLSGMLVTVLAVCVFCILNMLLIYPMETVAEQPVLESDWLVPFIGILCRFGCFGAMGSLTGLLISLLTMNHLMAWIGPFILDYLLIILYERYLDDVKLLYPKEWLIPEWNWPLKDAGICIWLILLCGVLYCVVIARGKKVIADAL